MTAYKMHIMTALHYSYQYALYLEQGPLERLQQLERVRRQEERLRLRQLHKEASSARTGRQPGATDLQHKV